MPVRNYSDIRPGHRMRFKHVSGLLQGQIRGVGEKRGIPIARLLTHWAEIVGDDIARIARPLNISYSRDGLGGTLTLLAPGPQAPILAMKLESIRNRVNACFGYSAISGIRISQVAPADFYRSGPTEGQQRKTAPEEVAPIIRDRARKAVAEVSDDELRHALERFGEGVLSNLNRK